MRALWETVRSVLAQPLAVPDRRRLAAVCIGALALLALALSVVRSDEVPDPRPAARGQVVDGGQRAEATETPDPALVPIPEEGEGEPASSAQVAAAKRAARAFLRGYMPLANGRGGADALTHVSDGLRAELIRNPPRPASARDPDRPPPRIQNMQVTGSSPERLALLVLAIDGDLTISFRLGMARYAEGWLVTDLEG